MWRRLDACGLRRPRPAAARPAPCALRRKTLARFPGSAPCRVRIPGTWPKPKNGPVAGAVSNSMVGDEGFRVRLRRPRPAAARPAPCALRRKTLARFPGSAPCRVRIPGTWPKPKNGPVAGAVSNSMVGDEGFRVRLRRPRPAAARPAPRALRRKTLARFPGSAPFRVRIPGTRPKPKKQPRCRSRFKFNGGR